MKSVQILISVGSIAVGVLIDKYQQMYDSILGQINPALPDAILISLVAVAVMAAFLYKKEHEYKPNPQQYSDHIKKIYESIKKDLAENYKNDVLKQLTKEPFDPNFYETIKKSAKKREILQHLVTFITYKGQKINPIMSDFIAAHSAEKTLSGDLLEFFIKDFNKSFQHLYEIMQDSSPLMGICDGCKADYVGEDRKLCLHILNNFNKDKDQIIKRFFE